MFTQRHREKKKIIWSVGTTYEFLFGRNRKYYFSVPLCLRVRYFFLCIFVSLCENISLQIGESHVSESKFKRKVRNV